MNLPGQATLRSSGVKARQPRWPLGPFAGVEPALDVRALPPHAAHCLVVVVRGARERSLAAEGFLGSFFPLARAPDTVGCAEGPRALAPGRRLGAEVVEALHEPHRPQLAEGEAARGMVRGSPQRR